MSPIPSLPAPTARRGFALLGLLAAVGVVLALAGILLPLTLEWAARGRLERTEVGLDRLERAVREYADDTLSLPPMLRDLLAPACAPRGWAGPYLGEAFVQAPPGFPLRADADAFGSLVRWVSLSPAVGELRSAGPNGAWGDGDDLVRRVDLRPSLRAETLRRIAVINGAIRRFLASEPPEALWRPGEPFEAALTALRARNYLDDDPAWDADAWGSPFVADATAAAGLGGDRGKGKGLGAEEGLLLVRVTSSNL